MRHVPLSFIAAALILSLQASAQPLPKIEFEKYTLANGLQVILHANKRIPAVNVNLWYHVGSKNEEHGRTGFAHLFEHMMFQGSKHVQGEYLQLAEQAGANLRTGGVNGTTNRDRTNYFETVPTGSLEYALWLESDRMGFLDDALTQEKFANQQDVVKNEKRQGDNSPYSAVQYLVAEHLYPAGHPYGHTVIGSIEDLTNATLDDVRAFFNTWYVPNNCTLTLSGDFDTAEARRLVEKYFGPLEPGEPLARPGVNIPHLGSTKQVHVKDRVPQARLYLKYAVPQQFSAEEAPLDYAAAIVGQGRTSYLYRKLVHELELASSVSAYNSADEICGEFTIVVTARPGKQLDDILDVIDEQIALFAESGPTEEELRREKAQSQMQFLSSLERIGGFGGIADKLNQYNTYLGDPGYFQEDFDRYQNVSGEDVRREFTRWVETAHRLEVYVTPEESGRPDQPEFDRSTAPPTAAAVAFTAPRTERTVLENGLEVIVSTQHELPVVSSRLIIRRQNLLEPAERAGVSRMTADMMDAGTESRTALQIREELEQYGSTMSVSGGKTGAEVNMRSLRRYIEQTMDIMADCVLHPAFPDDELRRQRNRSLDDLKQRRSDAGRVADLLFFRMLYGADHPLGQPNSGTEKSLELMIADDLRQTWNTYWRPNNAAIVFVGDITLDDAVVLVQKHLGEWKSAELPAHDLPPIDPPASHHVYLVDKQDAPQSQIRIGSLAPDRLNDAYYELLVTNTLLGGSFASRLNLNLREDKGYTYGAFCRYNAERDHGAWMATAGVQTRFTQPSLVEFRKEITGLAGSRPVTATELDGVKRNMTRGYVQNFESTGMLLGQIAPLVEMNIPVEDLERYIPEVEKQTPANVMANAARYYDFSRAITVVVGDLSKIESEIRALGWGTVTVLDEEGNVLR